MNPIDIGGYFLGIDYPAHRDDLIRIAKQAGAMDEDVRLIRELPCRNYDGAFDVRQTISRIQSDHDLDVA